MDKNDLFWIMMIVIIVILLILNIFNILAITHKYTYRQDNIKSILVDYFCNNSQNNLMLDLIRNHDKYNIQSISEDCSTGDIIIKTR